MSSMPNHPSADSLYRRTWRALGQAVLIYLSIGSCALTAQQNQPGRETFGEMIAFARLASVACGRLAPDAEGFHALALRTLVKPPLTEKEIVAKEKTSSSFEFVSGFASGASATPMKWPKLAFWLRFSENKISWSKTMPAPRGSLRPMAGCRCLMRQLEATISSTGEIRSKIQAE